MSAPLRPLTSFPIPTTAAQPQTDTNPPTKVAAHHLSAFYGDFLALRDISVEFGSGRITSIIGPSGCGKSTLIRSLNRMNDLVPGFRTEGEILLDGENIAAGDHDVIQMRRRMGMLFQRPNPFAASIFDNVAYGLRLGGKMGRQVLSERVHASLERVGLLSDVKDRLTRSALSLSGGQQQRLCLARALAVEPEVILMDEPCSALDPIATLRIEELMRELRGEVTIVIVTHNMQQAARVSDDTAFMMMGDGRAGELVEFGPTVRVFSQPEDSRTEDYITGRFG